MRAHLKATTIAAAALAGALCGPQAATAATAQGQATITWTAHGIPHIVASDFRGLGYGYGYAMGRIDVCGMADMFATFSGDRARLYGEDKSDLNRVVGRRPINNAANDFVRRLLVDDAHLAAARQALSPQMRGLAEGYAAGFNRYVADTPKADLPAACRDLGVVQPVTGDAVLRRAAGMASLLSSGLLLQELYDAAPPAPGAAAPAAVASLPAEYSSAGSNGYGFGKAVTGGSGLLLGNPHFFWDGPDRFVEAHLKVPGKYDVMGMSLVGLPLIVLGFNQSIAWTHTVSTDSRGGVYKLKLDPADPTRYLIDGRSVAMTRRSVTISVRGADGAVSSKSHDFWTTRFGPILMGPGLPWTHEVAYALSDSNRDNTRILQQWLEIGQSRDVGELKQALDRVDGLPWVNTIAADSSGKAFYADISVAADLTPDKLAACRATFPFAFAAYLAPLDGTRSECEWSRDPSAVQPGLMPTAAKPSLTTDTYVENSNASPWLVNPAHPLEGFSPLVGPQRTVLNFRSRQGHVQVEDRLSGRDGLPGRTMTMQTLEAIFSSDRSLQAEASVGELVRACQKTPSVVLPDGSRQDLTQACKVLAGWDRRYDLDSVGGHLFATFVAKARPVGGEDIGADPSFWKTPFDANDPVHTPRDLNADNPRVLVALGQAVRILEQAHIPLDAPLKDVQFVERNGRRIPLHGGSAFSTMNANLKPGVGFTEPMGPSDSYIQVVGFENGGPVADAVLASSQSPDPASPFYADQTELFSQKKWVRLPFDQTAVAAEAIGTPTVLRFSEPR
jgi:acyl-homoserine-lactone acylase